MYLSKQHISRATVQHSDSWHYRARLPGTALLRWAKISGLTPTFVHLRLPDESKNDKTYDQHHPTSAAHTRCGFHQSSITSALHEIVGGLYRGLRHQLKADCACSAQTRPVPRAGFNVILSELGCRSCVRQGLVSGVLYECAVVIIFVCFADGCQHDQNGSHSGNFSSLNYPINYPNKKRCTWGITVPGDYRIRVAFHDFQTQRNSDVLKIYDGASNSSDLLETLSGDLSGSTYGSSGSSLWFEFTSDGSTTAKGFHATYKAVPSTYRLESHPIPKLLDIRGCFSSATGVLFVCTAFRDFCQHCHSNQGDRVDKVTKFIYAYLRSFIH